MANRVAPGAFGQAESQYTEFLNLDLDTGEVVAYVFDGVVARPATADEITASRLALAWPDAARPAGARGFEPGPLDDQLDDQVDEFIRRYERAYGEHPGSQG